MRFICQPHSYVRMNQRINERTNKPALTYPVPNIYTQQYRRLDAWNLYKTCKINSPYNFSVSVFARIAIRERLSHLSEHIYIQPQIVCIAINYTSFVKMQWQWLCVYTIYYGLIRVQPDKFFDFCGICMRFSNSHTHTRKHSVRDFTVRRKRKWMKLPFSRAQQRSPKM